MNLVFDHLLNQRPQRGANRPPFKPIKKLAYPTWGLPLVIALSACVSRPTFQPEVGGAGAMDAKGSVIYSIPPKQPVLKMKLVTAGIDKNNMLVVRMFFRRSGQPAGEYLDPKEQVLMLPDSTTAITPARVHASAGGNPLVRLAKNEKQSVELLFPLPSGSHRYPHINLTWKLHYQVDGKTNVMSENERFDFVQKPPPQQGVGQAQGDLDFPFDVYGPFPEDWTSPDMMWW